MSRTASRRGAAGRVSTPLPREVRLIGGTWRRSKLPVVDRPGLRPTPDRVRETLFNWLGQDLTGWRVLDAYAGTGALGFEAASRGAADVVLVESDPAVIAALDAARQRLQAQAVRVVRGDALAWMARSASGVFDLVLIDPPYALRQGAAAAGAAMRLLAPGGYLYVEGDEALADVPEGLLPHRNLVAGAVHAQLLRRAPG